jgi:hypothetical protein
MVRLPVDAPGDRRALPGKLPAAPRARHGHKLWAAPEVHLVTIVDTKQGRDIVCDIMNRRKVERLRSEIDRLRGRGGIKSVELERLAAKLGRRLSKRGKEPTWVNDRLPTLRPVSIPNHPGDLNRHTAGSILDQLESDLDQWEALLPSSGEVN